MHFKLGATLFLVSSLLLCAGNDWLIVPGKRVGPITRSTTRADLVRLFGAANVIDGDVTIGDEDSRQGAILYPPNPADSFSIQWTDSKPSK